MKITDRNGNSYHSESRDKTFLLMQEIYGSAVSRACMKVICSPFVGKAADIALDSKTSADFIDSFAEKHGIDLFDFEKQEYDSFYDFFIRKFKKGRRVIDPRSQALVCPCDGYVTAYALSESGTYSIRNARCIIGSLLRDRKLEKKFADGTAIVIHLDPADPHRYIYPCSGFKSRERRINGKIGIVHPVADFAPVYKENMREYCLIRNPLFGDLVQMELSSVGVGDINNFEPNKGKIEKGCDKGTFGLGRSTIVILTEPCKTEVCADLLENTRRKTETKLKMGEVIAIGKG